MGFTHWVTALRIRLNHCQRDWGASFSLVRYDDMRAVESVVISPRSLLPHAGRSHATRLTCSNRPNPHGLELRLSLDLDALPAACSSTSN
mgnify:CR=1 FL=1